MSTANEFADLSSHNGTPDLAAYKAAGHTHISLKATEGTGYAWFAGNALHALAHQLGMTVTRYHWLRPDFSATAQANWFLSVVGPLMKPGDRTMNDFEATGGASDPADAVRADQLHDFNARVKANLPHNVIDNYTGNWYLAGKLACQSEMRRQGNVVMSDYSHDVPPNPYELPYVAHQFADNARVAGCDGGVDLNRWIGAHGTDSGTATLITPGAPQEEDMPQQFKAFTDLSTGRIFLAAPGYWQHVGPSQWKAALARDMVIRDPKTGKAKLNACTHAETLVHQSIYLGGKG